MSDSISSVKSILANGRKVIVKRDKTKTNRAHNENKSEIKTTKPNRIVSSYHTNCMCVFVCDWCLGNDYSVVSFVDEFYAISTTWMAAESESKTEKELVQSNRWPNFY